MGSPISRDFVISFRLNGEEIAKIDKVRDGTNRTRNDYSRSIIQGHLNLEISEPVKPVRLPPRKMASVYFFIWTYFEKQIRDVMLSLVDDGIPVHDAIYSKMDIPFQDFEDAIFKQTGFEVKISN